MHHLSGCQTSMIRFFIVIGCRTLESDSWTDKKIGLEDAELGTEKVPPKNLCDKDFAELSGELSGA